VLDVDRIPVRAGGHVDAEHCDALVYRPWMYAATS
jgi:hypothetical protein